ncbi:hypothetical protein Pan44_20700 [Caulifigura coniformis]|uniref:Planctomycete cytochrome C n=1 Tax=Caulifigura coniformis TaxID=2527983 RepID=A0A517SD41_9PLAN|nr:DUF1549 and DUF1553 domain-containing protein [Caulifigura coniformis]QDT54043.1 hypothetical protein Pan44_20700 [Caulifigura coniformis]
MSRRTASLAFCCTALLVFGAAGLFADEPAPDEPPISADDRGHWSYRPLATVHPPAVADTTWGRTPIDRFILARLEQKSLRPMPEADRATLLRRITFDLTGLPPTPGELRDFLSSEDPDAYEQVVDRLLASPRYGERWGQHWLDVARYADTDGFEFDAIRPNAWRYRDWVIDAFDHDMPYGEFVRRQIAGDLVEPDNPASIVATGFLLCGPDMPDINLQEERRHTVLNEMTGAVGEVFLGMQMGCAACHNHKFDPISQLDFYRLRAFFEPCELFREQPLASAEQRQAIAELQKQQSGKWKELEAERNRLMAEDPEINAPRIKAIDGDLAKLKGALPAGVALGRAVQPASMPVESRLYARGDFRRIGPVVSPAVPRVAGSAAVESTLPEARTTLADWIASPENGLAVRVMVNRIWLHHFGRGLSENPNDFGSMGTPPSHPELLEWLANEFVSSEGSVKSLHRRIVTSADYRTAGRSEADPARWNALLEADPDNRLLGRMPRRRLDGEEIRDAMLAAAGSLNDERFGPGVRPPLPAEVVSTLLKNQWNVTPGKSSHTRRSAYLFVRRNLRFPLFEVFDRPDANQSCPRRHESTTAPQALTLLNSQFTWTCAESLATEIARSAQTPAEQADAACRIVLTRPATPQDAGLLAEAGDLTTYCAALLNASEFLYVE